MKLISAFSFTIFLLSLFLNMMGCTDSSLTDPSVQIKAPSEVSISRSAVDSVCIRWLYSNGEEDGYIVFKLSSNDELMPIDTVSRDKGSATIKCLKSDSINIQVGAYCKSGELELSEIVVFNDWPMFMGVDPKFIDHGSYVKDTSTGLFWQKDGKMSGKLNFYQSADYADTLSLGGFSDWRVPTSEEYASIFPAVYPPFINTSYTNSWDPGSAKFYDYDSYWTCEIAGDIEDDYAILYHWYRDGGKNGVYASSNYVYVRCVRG